MSEKKYLVYRHTAPNGKMYIGVTSLPTYKRWRYGYGYKNNPYFFNAIQKYGWNNFKHEILLDNLTREEASLAEEIFITYWNLTQKDKGYNINNGGLSNYEISDETRRKMSEAHKGKRHSDSTKEKISKNHADVSGINHPLYGTHRSEETKRKLSKANSGINGGFYGRHHTKESKQKMLKSPEEKLNLQLKSKRKPVYQIDIKTGKVISQFNSIREASIKTQIARTGISYCCNGKCKTYGGYIWKFHNIS